jgi:hypothetical protein
MTYGSPVSGPIVPPVREGHRRRFNEADKRQILEEAVQAGASLSEVAHRYGIAARVLFRWKQELTPSAAPVFAAVRIGTTTPGLTGSGGARPDNPRRISLHLALSSALAPNLVSSQQGACIATILTLRPFKKWDEEYFCKRANNFRKE